MRVNVTYQEIYNEFYDTKKLLEENEGLEIYETYASKISGRNIGWNSKEEEIMRKYFNNGARIVQSELLSRGFMRSEKSIYSKALRMKLT